MTIKLKKCSFFSKIIDYLGNITAPGKLHVTTKSTEAIRALHYLTTVSELQQFLGSCNIYERFVLNLLKLAPFLTKKLKKAMRLQFSLKEKKMKAVKVLKDK